MGNTFRPTKGKWYCEIYLKTRGSVNGEIDYGWLQATTYSGATAHAGVANKWGAYYHGYSTARYVLYDEASQLGSDITYEIAQGDVLQLAWDIDNAKGWIGVNNTWYRTDASDGNPSAGTNEAFSWTADEAQNLQVYVANGTSTDVFVANFGQDSTFAGSISASGNTDAKGYPFKYTPPTGFLALCSANLSEPTLSPAQDEQATDHFQVYTFTGDANSTRTISGLNFQPDLLWSKARNQAFSHNLYDSSRGNDKAIQSNNSNAENTYDLFNGFTSDGYNTTTDGSAGDLLNYNGGTYVNFLWKANAGTTTTNDASATSVGTIDSVYQANTTAGFSIVTYTGTGSAGSIAHGLGGVPEVMIIKNRSEAHSWSGTYHHKMASDPHTDYLNLSGSGAVVDDNTQWNDTAPTSTVFTVGTANNTNKSSNNYVGYFFRGIEGFSKFGSLTANGSADGTYCHIGFQPSLVIVKQSSATGDWNMIDTTRQGHNHANGLPVVRANSSAVEEQASGNQGQIDILSNGFKFRSAHSSFNTSGATVVYMAFAEIPEKYSNAF